MKKMKLTIGLFLIMIAVACGQKAQTFDKVVTFNAGFRFTSTGTIYTSLPSGGTADWNTMINKPATFPSTWATVSGKPSVFNPDLSVTNPLYKPIGYVPTYAEITNKPAEVELATAILQVTLFEVLTQAQIDALVPTRGKVVINSTDNVLQWYDGTVWRTLVTTN